MSIVNIGVKPSIEPTYFGDGVYASFDGYQIWLEVDREGSKHSIAIDLDVYQQLRAYGARIWEFKP